MQKLKVHSKTCSDRLNLPKNNGCSSCIFDMITCALEPVANVVQIYFKELPFMHPFLIIFKIISFNRLSKLQMAHFPSLCTPKLIQDPSQTLVS